MEVEKIEKKSGCFDVEVVDRPTVPTVSTTSTSSIENANSSSSSNHNSVETQEIELSGNTESDETLDEIKDEIGTAKTTATAVAMRCGEKFEIEKQVLGGEEKGRENKIPPRCSNAHISMSPIDGESPQHPKRVKLDWFYILPIFYFCLPAFVSLS